MKCRACGLKWDEHHDFDPEMPEGCVCDHGTWGTDAKIWPVCAQYVGDGRQNCGTCEHDRACHKG